MVKNGCIWAGWLFLMGLGILCSCKKGEKAPTNKLPNIVIILADDLGYGDLGCYNDNSLIPTPNLDRLATEGIRLTDAYCPVAVCSPSRFALMTGNYPFRSWKKSGVMANYEPSMMTPGQLTLPKMLQNAGYTTAGFGKWHLGASFPTVDGQKPAGFGKFRAEDNGANIDVNQPIEGGPVDYGFEYWYGFSCASECWILQEREIVAALQHDFYNINAAPNSNQIEIVPSEAYLNRITKKSIQFLRKQVKASPEKPFFLYYAPYVPHIPLSVSREFQGTTQAGLYGDYVHELDTHIGRLLNTLDSLQQKENTIVLFASDNGSQFQVTNSAMDLNTSDNDLKDLKNARRDDDMHYPNGPLKGTKWTAWEGGVRTPFIAHWPNHFPENTESSALFALNDVMATLAKIIDYKLPDNAAVDSHNQLPILKGGQQDIRISVVIRASGNQYGFRKGEWKYIEPMEEGKQGELYNLKEDISETKNRYKEYPELVQELKEHLNKIIQGTPVNVDEP